MVQRRLRVLVTISACLLVPPAAAGLDSAAAGLNTAAGLDSPAAAEPDIPGIHGLPGHVAEKISAHPQAYYWAIRKVTGEPKELLRLVDRSNGLDDGYEPDDLVELSNAEPHIQTNGRQQVTERTAESLSRMVRSAREDGVELVVSSAYRSYDRQEALHDYWIDELGESLAVALSAPPGHSQHQLGTTIDFAPVGRAFEDTPSDRWLRENAWRYGFSLSYPEGYEEVTGYNYESWHYRYIGTAASYVEKRFFAGIQQHMLEYLHDNRREIERWTGRDHGDPASGW